VSDNPPRGRLAGVVERLHRLYPRMIDLSTDRLMRLLGQLGNPQDHLPPVIHVAGTNGKGSTCAFLRAMGEAAGMRVHVFTSPHLVRFNERIRIAGRLVDDDTLEAMFAEIEAINAGAPITVFEVLMAAAFTLYVRHPAELCVLEVGLGGRHDATNVIARPAACAIASISLDHREMLGPTLERIAFEKAGIIKPGVPVVTGAQAMSVLDVFAAEAALQGAELRARGYAWEIVRHGGGLRFHDAEGWINLPPPSLPGAYQVDNAGLAVAAIRAAGLGIGTGAIARGIGAATWPARMQRLRGRLVEMVPPGWEVWLDGGHNPGGGLALADQLATWRDRPTHVIVGMKQSKDTTEFLRPLIPLAASLWAVAEPQQHAALPVEAIVAASGGVAQIGPTVVETLAQLQKEGAARVLICGSLYLAGEVLTLDGSSIA
jgi:dihydrofolate synthase/folylpolyglutamate synthase